MHALQLMSGCARTGQNGFGLLSLNLCMAVCTTVRFRVWSMQVGGAVAMHVQGLAKMGLDYCL